MRIKISDGNSKIGKIPNINLPPGVTCRADAKCYHEGCYARKAYRMYPSAKAAWDANWEFYQEDPEEYFAELSAWLLVREPKLFRYHSSGDIPDQWYLDKMVELAKKHTNINFLCYTKRYSFDFSARPDNLQIILSTWPGMPLPTNRKLPWAFLEMDYRNPENSYYFKCPGNCSDCDNICWNKLEPGINIVFAKH